MLLAGTLIFLLARQQANEGRLQVPDASTRTESTADVSTPSGQPEDSDPATPSSQPENAAAAAAAALKACRAKVEAADKVLAAAKPGMENWSDHVQAQTDANAGEITAGEMEDIFNRTMKDGDEDEKQYSAAEKNFEEEDGSCKEVAGAPAAITEQLARCAERERALEPVLGAAKDGMEDWIKHLGEMRRSAQGKIHNPQQKWFETWRAAPKNINAYDDAVEKFSAPRC